MTKADECTDAEIEPLFFALTPIVTSIDANGDQVTLLDFTDTNKEVCDDAKALLTNDDYHSDTFLDKFCECSIRVGFDILTQENIDYEINGLNVKSLQEACGERFCTNSAENVDVRSKCFCEGSWLVSNVPPNLDTDTQNEQISTYCSGV